MKNAPRGKGSSEQEPQWACALIGKGFSEQLLHWPRPQAKPPIPNSYAASLISKAGSKYKRPKAHTEAANTAWGLALKCPWGPTVLRGAVSLGAHCPLINPLHASRMCLDKQNKEVSTAM